MKKTLIVFMALSISASAMAQGADKLPKAEKKRWKKEARMMKKHPELLKELSESNDDALAEVAHLEFTLDSLQVLADAYKNDMTDRNRTIAKLQKELKTQQELLAKAQAEENKKAVSDEKGITFRVQIGAFTKRDMSAFFSENGNFRGETENDMQKYTVGIFREKLEAETFKAHLKAIGIKDAWIVKYVDGRRENDKGAVVATSE